ncbi:PREDICTED: tumor necrosis factor receptor superfamily member 10D-like, partial [Mandrillus leucophaeus]|uniref:tumor necrosis factor receptor superfamily member 10D-like n=1 Tax=Mandrillus leucophaeus TaxID=9568 RepID=UPI0005F58303
VQVDSATISRQDEVPPPPVASQQQRRSLEEKCPAGFHRSEHTGACNACTKGVDYTNASNNEPSCLPCAVCKSGKFMDSNCTRWSDISCTAPAASSTEKTVAAEDTVTTSLGTPASPGFVLTIFEWIFIVAGVLVIIVLMAFCISCWKKLISSLKGICSGGGGDPERVHRVSWFLQKVGASWVQELLPIHWRARVDTIPCPHSCPDSDEAWEDNAHKETLSTRFLHPTQVSEQEIEGQEPTEPTDVTVQSPEEPGESA